MSWQIGEWLILRPLWLLPALLLVIAAFVWRPDSYHNHWRKILSPALFRFLGADTRRASRCNLPLLVAAVAALSFCLPVQRQSDDDTWRHSIGWLAVADVSRSMTLDDTVPSRLAAMREALAQLSRQAGARPIALILFSGDAFLIAPPAFDRSIFNEHTALLEHGVIPVEGSNLARALSLATSVIEDSQLLRTRIFVLGDSGGIGKSSIAAARFLADAGHQVDTLVFGSSEPMQETSSDERGDETAVDWQQAQALSRAGHGISVRANSFGVIDYDQLELDKQSSVSTHAALSSLVWQDQSHWLLLLGIPLLLQLFRQESAH
ncbi:VWA domain-containing protein [Granulosicoccus antarcticus]|nr:VWA domain-containing protein [Granulosicoccus antarcticus]